MDSIQQRITKITKGITLLSMQTLNDIDTSKKPWMTQEIFNELVCIYKCAKRRMKI